MNSEERLSGSAPVDPTEVRNAEDRIGFRFPELPTTAWGQIGAGKIIDHPHSLFRPSEVALRYERHRSDIGTTQRDWPEGLVRIADLGRGMPACVELSSPEATMWWFDPNLDGTRQSHAAPWRTSSTLEDWMPELASGSTFEKDWPPTR